MSQIRATERDRTPDVAEATHYVLGGSHLGIAIGERLQADGHRVAVVDESSETAAYPELSGAPTDVSTLREAGLDGASTAIVATRSDRRNLLIAQLVRTTFDVERIVTFVNEPGRHAVFTTAGHEPFCVTTSLTDAFVEAL